MEDYNIHKNIHVCVKYTCVCVEYTCTCDEARGQLELAFTLLKDESFGRLSSNWVELKLAMSYLKRIVPSTACGAPL